MKADIIIVMVTFVDSYANMNLGSRSAGFIMHLVNLWYTNVNSQVKDVEQFLVDGSLWQSYKCRRLVFAIISCEKAGFIGLQYTSYVNADIRVCEFCNFFITEEEMLTLYYMLSFFNICLML